MVVYQDCANTPVTPATPRQRTRLTTTNEVEINGREKGVNTCQETTYLGSNIRGKLFPGRYLHPIPAR